MKILEKGLYYFKDKQSKKIRMWHDCDDYKGGRHGKMRIELSQKGENSYVCKSCGLKHSLKQIPS